METQIQPETEDLSGQAVENLSGSKNLANPSEDIALENVGEDVGTGLAEDAGLDAGLASADAGIEGVAAGLDATGVGALVGIPLGIAGLIGSLVGIFDHHSSHAPPPPLTGRPSLDVGV
jgi:tetrahydromethanopterin S-methyltransferase subunit F